MELVFPNETAYISAIHENVNYFSLNLKAWGGGLNIKYQTNHYKIYPYTTTTIQSRRVKQLKAIPEN
jgi:hypothetical protein